MKAIKSFLFIFLAFITVSAQARFLSVDPEGFSEGNPMSFNRYAYANNNPYKYVDPDGRAAVFTFTNGTQAVAKDVYSFKSIATQAAAGSIANLVIQGHGKDDGSFMNLDPTSKTEKSGIQLNGNGVTLQGSNGESLGKMSEILGKKIAENGAIDLQGCNSSNGDQNIARSLSKEMQGINVSGNPYKGVLINKTNQNNENVIWLPLPFSTKTYKNGNSQ